jgi:hypothetical protein
MAKTRYFATFSLPDGSEFLLTRGSRQDYDYTWAWLVLAGDGERVKPGTIIGKGFTRSRMYADQYANDWLRCGRGRTALFAPVTKGGTP